jgi:uncharacterized protein YigA (DUF484 family)
MSGHERPQALARDDEERGVLDYLRRHPDLLVRHPELLRVLQVPHACGGAVSLIEYQVESLKRQCHDLRERLSLLVDTARGNEEVAQRLHRLLLALVESHGLDELFTSLYQGLEEGFGADLVSLRVYAEPLRIEDRGLAELVGPDGEDALLAPLFQDAQPVCGHPRPELLTALFAERAARVASAAVLPLSIGDRRGVLAIGSHNASRFQPSMGTLYLRQLADLLGRLLARRVR